MGCWISFVRQPDTEQDGIFLTGSKSFFSEGLTVLCQSLRSQELAISGGLNIFGGKSSYFWTANLLLRETKSHGDNSYKLLPTEVLPPKG